MYLDQFINYIHAGVEKTNCKPDGLDGMSRKNQNIFCGPLLPSLS